MVFGATPGKPPPPGKFGFTHPVYGKIGQIEIPNGLFALRQKFTRLVWRTKIADMDFSLNGIITID